MKTETSNGKSNRTRVIFCLGLILAMVCSIFALNGFAAGADPAVYNIAVDSCSTHTAAVANGDLYVWGSNGRGQFPNSSATYSIEPVKVASDVAQASVSPNRTLVLYKNGRLYAYGQDPLSGAGPTAETVYAGVAQVSCAEDFALLVTKKGALLAWGANDYSQLGTGDTQEKAVPTTVIESGVKKAVAGDGFALALKEDGSLYGWGLNASNQLGYQNDAGEVPETLSTPTLLLKGVQDIDAGGSYSCILKNDGTLWTCGMNDFQQLGLSSLETSAGLTQILDGVRSVAAGTDHCFAIGKNGTVYRWGFGLSGQLGNKTWQRGIGAAPSDLDFVQLFAGNSTSFGVASDGSVWAWGGNTNHLLGTAFGDDTAEPVKILNPDMTWAFSEQAPEDDKNESGSQGGANDAPDSPSDEPSADAFVNGYPDGTFRPANNISRAEFLKMLVSALCDYDASQSYGASTFTDVKSSEWYAPYIAYAQKNDLIDGYKDGTFRPEATISREEAAKLTATIMGLTADAEKSSFTDVKGWALPYIEVLASKGVLAGDGGGIFRPEAFITRAEAAKIVAAATGFDAKAEETIASISGVKNPFGDVNASSWEYPYILRAAGLVK